MIAEIGHFALIISLGLGLLLSILPMVGGASKHSSMLMGTARPLSWGGMFLMLSLSFCILLWAFIPMIHSK